MEPETLEALDGGADLGRRERKKLETRTALIRAGLELFTERGVDATTVDDITDAVDVSPRTFHRYFAAKEDLLFADTTSRREHFSEILAARPAEERLLDSLRVAAGDMADSFLANSEVERRRLRLIRGSDALRARNLHQTDEWSQMVAEHAAARLGQSPRDPLPVLLAACTIAALRTAIDRWLESPGADYRAELDRCFDLLASLDAATTPHGSRSTR